jgi:death on curing protein
LAASYGYGLARNDHFPDGIKRIALAATDVFLAINGVELLATEPDAVVKIRSLAAGEMTEDELAQWIRANSTSK